MTHAQLAIVVLVLGAVMLLLMVGVISTHALRATLIGLPFAVVAALFGIQSPHPFGLAIVALCAVAALGLLLLPVLDAEVPVQVAEAAALLLLGAGGAIALATASDLLQAVVGLETLALSAVKYALREVSIAGFLISGLKAMLWIRMSMAPNCLPMMSIIPRME